MPRLHHPRTGKQVDVHPVDHQLLAYYRAEGYREVSDPLPPIKENVGRELFHPGYGKPLAGTEVPLGDEAETSNDPDDEPGDHTLTDSGDPAGTSLEL